MPPEIIPLAPHIGAEIRGVDLRAPIDRRTREAIHAAWLKHVVLLFRDQDLSQQNLLDVTTIFGQIGQLARPKAFRPPGFDRLLDNIMLISNIRENGEPIGALPDGEMMFHHDMMHAAIPHKGTLLYAVEVPSHGGDTVFASGYAAYDALPDAVRAPLEGKRAFHHYNYGSVQKGDGKGTAAFAESSHPVFRTHDDTGRKAIYVNRLMTERVEGLSAEDSARLLNLVYDHAEKPDWLYAHVWRPRDLLIWDNRCSMHARTDFPAGERRLMLRTTVAGEAEPV